MEKAKVDLAELEYQEAMEEVKRLEHEALIQIQAQPHQYGSG